MDLPYGVTCRNPDHACPDCLDGKRRIAAVVPCEACNGSGAQLVTYPDFDAIDCVAECDDGHVTVATVVVEWGPLVVSTSFPVGGDHDYRRQPGNAVVVAFEQAVELWTWGDRSAELPRRRTITLPPDVDPATLVGQYALGIRKVET